MLFIIFILVNKYKKNAVLREKITSMRDKIKLKIFDLKNEFILPPSNSVSIGSTVEYNHKNLLEKNF